MERILLKRIRDLKFDQINNSIILALEDFHSYDFKSETIRPYFNFIKICAYPR